MVDFEDSFFEFHIRVEDNAEIASFVQLTKSFFECVTCLAEHSKACPEIGQEPPDTSTFFRILLQSVPQKKVTGGQMLGAFGHMGDEFAEFHGQLEPCFGKGIYQVVVTFQKLVIQR